MTDAGVMRGVEAWVPNLAKMGRAVDLSDLRNGDVVILRSGGHDDGHVGIWCNGRIIHNSSSRNEIVSVPDSAFVITAARRFTESGEGPAERSRANSAEVPWNDAAERAAAAMEPAPGDGAAGLSLRIKNRSGKWLRPVVAGAVEWSTYRRGAPAKLSFNLVKDAALDYAEGDLVILDRGAARIFRGRVVSKSRGGDGLIETTACDNLFHLSRSRATYNFRNKTASDIIKIVAADFGIPCGRVIQTSYVFPARLFERQTLLDIMETALQETYVRNAEDPSCLLYDDPAEGLRLRRQEDLRLSVVLDSSRVGDCRSSSTLDGSFNVVRIEFDEDGVRRHVESSDPSNESRWGRLMLTERAADRARASAVAPKLLELKDVPGRSLRLSGVDGVDGARAGFLVAVNLSVGDEEIRRFMVIDEARHRISADRHDMDLSLKGLGYYE